DFSDAGGFNPATTPVGAILNDSTTNVGITRVSGVQTSISYKLAGGASGDWQFAANSSSIFRFESAPSANAPFLSVLNTIYNPVRLTARGSVNWTKGAFNAALFANYVRSYEDNEKTP